MPVIKVVSGHIVQLPEDNHSFVELVVFFHPAPAGVLYKPNDYEIAYYSYDTPHPAGLIPFHSEVDTFELQSACRGRGTGARHPLTKGNGAKAARFGNVGQSTIYFEFQ